MSQLMIVLAAILLIILLALIARPSGQAGVPAVPEGATLHEKIRHLALHARRTGMTHLKPERRLISAMQQVSRSRRVSDASVIVSSHLRTLALLQHRVQKELRSAPPLPSDQHGDVRMMLLCMALIESSDCVTPQQLLEGLTVWEQTAATTLHERQMLPVCMRLTLTRLLSNVMEDIRQDVRDIADGERLAGRLHRSRHPGKLATRIRRSPAFLYGLFSHADSSLLRTITDHTESVAERDNLTPARAQESFAAHQALLVRRIASILDTDQSLCHMDWYALLEANDPLHALLQADPSGDYPHMTADSRRMYREQTALLARRFHAAEAQVAQACLTLGDRAPAESLSHHVGWYLLEHEGRRQLRHHLHARRGWLCLTVQAHSRLISRIALAAGVLVASLLFLNRGHPLWSLPLILGAAYPVVSAVRRRLERRLLRQPSVPMLQIDAIDEQNRTLILMPAVLRDSAQAAELVHRLSVVREGCPSGAVDCLLLADHAPNPTAVSTTDAAVIASADAAVHALSTADRPFFYMQRSRSWDARRHEFCGRGGLTGARAAVDQLICTGVTDDAFDHATLDLSQLYRRYAYVLLVHPDALPAPDCLPSLIGTLAHPLNQRCETPAGMRGFSIVSLRIEADTLYDGSRLARIFPAADDEAHACLYRPGSLFEALQDVTSASDDMPPPLTMLLSGAVRSREFATVRGNGSTVSWLSSLQMKTQQHMALLRWLFPWIQTARGVEKNPLASSWSSLLHHALGDTLSSVCCAGLTLYGTLARSEVLVVLACLAAVLPDALRGWTGILRGAVRLALLPCRIFTMIRGAAQIVTQRADRREQPWIYAAESPHDPGIILSQSVGIIVLLGLSLMPWPPCFAGCAVAALWGCFAPVVHWLDSPASQEDAITDEEAASLMEIGKASWQYFADCAVPFPPAYIRQEAQDTGHTAVTSEGLAMYLPACVSAMELGIITPRESVERASAFMTAFASLPRWHGLPYAAYDMPALQPRPDAVITAIDCGLLCAGFLAAAQAYRARSDALPAHLQDLPSQLENTAHGMELNRLYDAAAKQLYRFVVPQSHAGSPDHHTMLADSALVTSLIMMMTRQASRNHYDQLDRTMVTSHGCRTLLSRCGGLDEYLVPSLFLPYGNGNLLSCAARAAVRIHRRAGRQGIFGLGQCRRGEAAEDTLPAARPSGVAGIALHASEETVIAPYTSALCLPFAHDAAVGNQHRLRALSMFGRYGFFEGLDCADPEKPRIVHCHTAVHTGMTLCAVCNALTGNSLQKYFSQLPAVQAWLPLFNEKPTAAVFLPVSKAQAAMPVDSGTSRHHAADHTSLPAEAMLLTGRNTAVLLSAFGSSCVYIGGQPVTRFTGNPLEREGPQLRVHEGDFSFSPADASLPGETIFQSGTAVYNRRCGTIVTRLTMTVDPHTGAYVQSLEITNLSQRERMLEISTALTPVGFDRSHVHRADEHTLLVTDGEDAAVLAHSLTSNHSFLTLDNATDEQHLSLRVSIRLGGHGHAVVRCCTGPDPDTAAAVAARHDFSDIPPAAFAVSRLFGAMFWHHPQQGANAPLRYPLQALAGLGVSTQQPLLLAAVSSPLCEDLLQEILPDLIHLHDARIPFTLCILAQGDEAPAALERVQELLADSPLHSHAVCLRASSLPAGMRGTVEAFARLTLYEGTDLNGQLAALSVPYNQQGDLLKSSLPGEQLIITENASAFSVTDPSGSNMQTDAALTTWHRAYDDLEADLAACALPWANARIRMLSLRNSSPRTRSIAVRYHVCLAMDADQLTHLMPLEAGAAAVHPAHPQTGWMCAAEPDVIRIVSASQPDVPTESGDTLAFLHQLTLSPGESRSLAWVGGQADTADDIAHMLRHVRRRGAAALIRKALRMQPQEETEP